MNRTITPQIITAGNMTGIVTSDVVDITYMRGVSIQCVWSGTPTGQLSLLASNNGIDFDTVEDSTISIAGVAGTFTYDYRDIYFRFIKLVYTPTSGTGTVNVFLMGKGY